MDLILISGHSSGLGAELTQVYLDAGATVIGMSRHGVPSKHPRLYEFHFDLARTVEWEQKLDAQLPREHWDRIVLFNNAGTINPTAPFGRMEGEKIQQAITLNLTTPLRLMNLILQIFPKHPIRIVNISSGAAKKPYEGWGAYCSSKAGLLLASRVLASEMESAGRDVRVISFSPGPLDTPMQAELRKKSIDDFPSVDRFIDMHNSGALRSPKTAARDLLALLGRADLPYFHEAN